MNAHFNKCVLCAIGFAMFASSSALADDSESLEKHDIGLWTTPDGIVQMWRVDNYWVSVFTSGGGCACGEARTSYFIGTIEPLSSLFDDATLRITGTMKLCTNPDLMKDCPNLPCVWEVDFVGLSYQGDSQNLDQIFRPEFDIVRITHRGEWYEQDDDGKYICTPDHTFEKEFEISLRITGPTMFETASESYKRNKQKLDDFLNKAEQAWEESTSYRRFYQRIWDDLAGTGTARKE